MIDRWWISFAGALALGCGPVANVPEPRQDGQWVWSSADSVVLASQRTPRFNPMPGVWVATIWAPPGGDSLRQTLALPPTTGGLGPVAAVVRFEPSLHAWWAGRRDADVADEIDRRLKALMELLDRSGVPIAEIQLDYDCPVRRLANWARVLRHLHRSSLAGRSVWMTSLVAHQRDPDFGRRMRGAVDGQIVQLFDTGEEPSADRLAELARLVPRQALPFRIGLGAFNRKSRAGITTQQTDWFRSVAEFERWPGFQGLWVFPAGFEYRRLIGGGG
jgi:hypothetical protein